MYLTLALAIAWAPVVTDCLGDPEAIAGYEVRCLELRMTARPSCPTDPDTGGTPPCLEAAPVAWWSAPAAGPGELERFEVPDPPLGEAYACAGEVVAIDQAGNRSDTPCST